MSSLIFPCNRSDVLVARAIEGKRPRFPKIQIMQSHGVPVASQIQVTYLVSANVSSLHLGREMESSPKKWYFDTCRSKIVTSLYGKRSS